MDWLFYIAHTHLNYSEEEFWNSTHKKICVQWNLHCNFNKWEFEDDNENNDGYKYKRVNIEDISFL